MFRVNLYRRTPRTPAPLPSCTAQPLSSPLVPCVALPRSSPSVTCTAPPCTRPLIPYSAESFSSLSVYHSH